MPKKRKPLHERTADDFREAAENALELAKVLVGEGRISDQDFLERTARTDELLDHDPETCGMCHYRSLNAQVARELLEAGEFEDVMEKWDTEARRRWEESKFFKLWEEEKKAGRDPHQAFKDRGWDP
jgi:hypothetical protein